MVELFHAVLGLAGPAAAAVACRHHQGRRETDLRRQQRIGIRQAAYFLEETFAAVSETAYGGGGDRHIRLARAHYLVEKAVEERRRVRPARILRPAAAEHVEQADAGAAYLYLVPAFVGL